MGCFSEVSKSFIIFLNIVTAIAGGIIIYSSVAIPSTKWLEIFQSTGDKYFQDSSFTILLSVGIVIVVISLAGCIGACFEKPWLLSFCTLFVAFAGEVFAILSVLCALSFIESREWKDHQYPSNDNEPQFASNFNKVYCYGQGLYLCTAAPAGDTLHALFRPIPGLRFSTLNEYKGINALCNAPAAALYKTVPSIKKMCDGCQNTPAYAVYDHIYDWSVEECPLSVQHLEQMGWCGDFLVNAKENDAFVDAPYQMCRTPVLEVWSKWSKLLATAAGGVTGLFVLLVLMACIIRRQIKKQRHRQNAMKLVPQQYGVATHLV